MEDNYSGKNAEQVWDEWTPRQRAHFIRDHYFCEKGFKQRKTADLQKISYGNTLMEYVKLKWNKIPDVPVKWALDSELFDHIAEGQYGKGGSLYNKGGKTSDGKPLYTKEELLKKFAGKFIDTYPHHHTYHNDETHRYETVYEVRGVSSKIKENFQSPEEVVYAHGGIITDAFSFLNKKVTLNDFKF